MARTLKVLICVLAENVVVFFVGGCFVFGEEEVDGAIAMTTS